MHWVWFGMIGGVLSPLVVFWSSIRVAFQEGGFVRGVAVWSGMCWITIPLALFVMWLFHLLAGK
jgi:hypothetical protein